MADKAYSTRLNHELARELGFDLSVPFKAYTITPPLMGSAWMEAWKLFDPDPEQFYREYHPRSNVEATIGALKRLMPVELGAKMFGGHVNEVLSKLVAYNLIVSARKPGG